MEETAKRVVVGVSGSSGSLRALRVAVDLARALDALLMPVVVWAPPGGDSPARPYPQYVTDEWADAAEARLVTAFDQALGGPPTELPTQPHVIRGRTGHVLVAVANRPDDLLVVGKGHPGFLRRTACGQIAGYCLGQASCPVITVPASALAADAGRAFRGLRLRRAPRNGAALLTDPGAGSERG